MTKSFKNHIRSKTLPVIREGLFLWPKTKKILLERDDLAKAGSHRMAHEIVEKARAPASWC